MIFGWPDTYLYEDYEACTIRNFCIMGGWSSGLSPSPPNPYFRYTAGWLELQDLTGQTGTWTSEANSTLAYTWTNPSNDAEFFLIQAQTASGFNVGIPDEGLTIWRIDENGDNQAYPQTESAHFQVDLVHANDVPTEMMGSTYHEGGIDSFGPFTSPSSSWWDGSDSGLALHSVSAAGSSMAFSIGGTDVDADTDVDAGGDSDADTDTDADADADADGDAGSDASVQDGSDDGCGCRTAGREPTRSLMRLLSSLLPQRASRCVFSAAV